MPRNPSPEACYDCPTCTRVFVVGLDGKEAPNHSDSLTGKACPSFVPIYT